MGRAKILMIWHTLCKPYTWKPDSVHIAILFHPFSWTQIHFLILKQTLVKQLLNHLMLQILSNED